MALPSEPVDVKLTRREYYAAKPTYFVLPRPWCYLVVAGGAIAVVAASVGVLPENFSGIAFLAVAVISLPWIGSLIECSELTRRVSYRFRTDGFDETHGRRTRAFSWNRLLQFDVSDQFLVFRTVKGPLVILPRRLLTDEEVLSIVEAADVEVEVAFGSESAPEGH